MNPFAKAVIGLELFLMALLLVLSTFFSAAETALTRLSKIKVKHWIYTRERNADAWAEWLANPQELLSTILVGNNFTNIYLSSLSVVVVETLCGHDSAMAAQFLTSGIVFGVVVIFAEIAPKLYCRAHPEQVAAYSLSPLKRLSKVMGRPFERSVHALGRVIPFFKSGSGHSSAALTLDEIRAIVQDASALSGLDADHQEMMRKLLSLHQKRVSQIMTPWSHIDFAVIDETLGSTERIEKVLDRIVESGRTRLPVVLSANASFRKNRAPQILGYIYVNDLFSSVAQEKKIDLSSFLRWVRPLPNLRGDKKVSDILDFFRFGVSIACVRDASDFPIGILTLEDVLEEFLGEILDEYDLESQGNPHE